MKRTLYARRTLTWVHRNAASVAILLVTVTLAVFAFALLDQANSTSRVCRIARGLARVESEFIRTDAIDRKGALSASERTRTLAGFRKIIAAGLLNKVVKEQNALDARTIKYWRDVLIPEANGLVGAAQCPSK